MPRLCWARALLAGAVVLLLAAEDATNASDEAADRNRRLLEKWRADPEHYQRLLRDLQAFHTLPTTRQDQLRKIDRDLHDLDASTQQRLWDVLEHYADWLGRLPDADRKRIEAATDRTERLRIIRQIRDRQFVEKLPVRDRQDVEKLPVEKRGAAIARLRDEERKRHQTLLRALRARPEPARPAPYRPARLVEFPAEIRLFVAEHLQPMLNREERDQLAAADGNWPRLAQTILELSDRHPVLPPAPGQAGVTRLVDLPPEFRPLVNRKQLVNKGQWGALHRKEGVWPDFAVAYTDLLRRLGKTPPRPLGACRPDEFDPPARNFVEKKLLPSLKEEERARLREMEGKWPEYPRLLHELAHARRLVIPGLSLPGPRELWDAARATLPEVPDYVLRDFAVGELSSDERARLNLTITDPTSRERLKQEFFRKHPGEIKRWRKVHVER